VRVFSIAFTALALRASPTGALARERRLVPAVDKPGAAVLDRGALDGQRAALIASLWTQGRCVAPAVFVLLPAPAVFGAVLRASWRPADLMDAGVLPAAEAQAQTVLAA
jgi:hypothetical protein